ncbi:MAG: hypothetical protein AB7O88_05190 [Reyranellaceae bacterium]
MALVLVNSDGDLRAQSAYTPSEPQPPPPIMVPPQPPLAPQPPTIIVPARPSPAPQTPVGITKPPQPGAIFCCTPYGRFGPVGGGQPGAPCQWTLPGSVTQGSTCN